MLTPTNSKITVASHVFSHACRGMHMHANPGINESRLPRYIIHTVPPLRRYSMYISRESAISTSPASIYNLILAFQNTGGVPSLNGYTVINNYY